MFLLTRSKFLFTEFLKKLFAVDVNDVRSSYERRILWMSMTSIRRKRVKGCDKNSVPVHWFSNSTGWMTGTIFQAYSKMQLFHELKEYCTSQGLPFKILMLLNNDPANPQWLSDLHSNIKFVYLLPNTTSLLQPMDQDVIKMFKGHFLQKLWRSLSMKCEVSLDERDEAAQALENAAELQKDVVWQ